MYTIGDILLVDDYSGQGDLVGNLILDGERSRYGRADWTHSALIVSTNGDLVEALERGVCLTNIRKYEKVRTKIISPVDVPAGDPRRAFACRFAIGQAGDHYGVVGFVGLAFLLAFGVNILPHLERQPICSELVSRATESYTRTGYQYSPERMMPQDIDVYWGAPYGPALPLYKRWLLLAQSLYWFVVPWRHGLKPKGRK